MARLFFEDEEKKKKFDRSSLSGQGEGKKGPYLSPEKALFRVGGKKKAGEKKKRGGAGLSYMGRLFDRSGRKKKKEPKKRRETAFRKEKNSYYLRV